MYQDIILKFPKSIGAACVSDSNEIIQYIFEDTDKRCVVHYNEDDLVHFTVNNNNIQTIHFLAIDHCLYSSSLAQKRCDCAVFNDSTFCFIEIKRKSGKIGHMFKEARAQLKAIIESFKQDFEKLQNYRLEAFASLGRGPVSPELTQTGYRPTLRPSFQAAILRFELETGAVLYIDDQKIF